jgi:type II secretory pathway predicted ATPase ExeA
LYEEIYGLKEKPFSILPDPDYIYWGRSHILAYAMLDYGILNHAGFTVITGEIGCGKTTLLRYLLSKSGDDLNIGLISNTQGEASDLYRWILMAFDQPHKDQTDIDLFDQLQKYLASEHKRGRQSVLIIDEAQNYGVETLEKLRMLSNMNADKDQLLQLILVGQPQLKDLLRRPELIQFSQRVSSDFHIGPFGKDETAEYIRHRLKIAGCIHRLFTVGAVAEIHRASRGIPRVINIICDTALVYGFSADAMVIKKEIVEKVIQDKAEHGVFTFGEPQKPLLVPLPELLKQEAGEGKEPALVINDRKLAQYFLSRLKDSHKAPSG